MAPLAGRPDAQTRARLKEIKLEDIDFEKVNECNDKHFLKRYIQLIEEDGSFFTDLLKACKDKLLKVDPREYFQLYPRVASEQEVDEATRDLLDWQEAVKETDDALRSSKKDRIWDDNPPGVAAPVRGQEPAVARPNLLTSKEQPRAAPAKKSDAYARDKTQMKDYYSAWDKVDVDALEAELDREEQEQEESRKRHFEDLRSQQADAQATSEISQIASPESVPRAHWNHMADSEKEKGNEAFYSKDYAEAEAYYSRSIHFRADDPSSWANRALVRLKLERPTEALEDCEHALALNGRYMKALHRKGKALNELRRYEDAVRYFQLALKESPGNTQINGDLMVARRHLRSDAAEEKPRKVDAPPTCRIEELPDDPPLTAGPAPGYTRVQIEEDSDSEDGNEGNAAPALANSAAARENPGFTRVQIEEVSDSEEGNEGDTAPALASSSAASENPGFTRVQIEEGSDSEDGNEGKTTPTLTNSSAARENPGFTRVQIEEGSDSEDGNEGSTTPALANSSAARENPGFMRVQIEEGSDSEDGNQGNTAPVLANSSAARENPGFRRVAIEEVSDSEDELPERVVQAPLPGQPAGSVSGGGVFAPPPRSREPELPPAPAPVLCFDDMD